MENTIENSMDKQMDMKGDDAAMVDSILNSLRDENGSDMPDKMQQMPNNMQQQQMPNNMQQQMPNNMQQHQHQQMPPNMQQHQQMPPNMQHHQNQTGVQHEQVDYPNMGLNEMPPDVEVEYDNNDSKINKVLTMLKKPLIIIALAFILFNPLTSEALAKYLPTVFGLTNSLIKKQVRVICLALILGLLFLGINNVL